MSVCYFAPCKKLIPRSNVNFTEETSSETSPNHDSDFDAETFGIAFGVAHIPLFAGIAVAVVIGCYCCYKRKKSGADLVAIAEKGGLVILDDQLLQAKEEGRLTVNVSILENGKV